MLALLRDKVLRVLILLLFVEVMLTFDRDDVIFDALLAAMVLALFNHGRV